MEGWGGGGGGGGAPPVIYNHSQLAFFINLQHLQRAGISPSVILTGR